MKILILLVLLCIVGCGYSHDPQPGKCYKYHREDAYAKIIGIMNKVDGKEIKFYVTSLYKYNMQETNTWNIETFKYKFPKRITCAKFWKYEKEITRTLEIRSLEMRIEKLEKNTIKESK